MSSRNPYAEAFKENFNILGLAGSVALAAALVSPLPLLVAFVAEAAFLIFVPDSRWYGARLARLFDADVSARRAKLKAGIWSSLRPELQQRFTRLEEVRRQIGALAFDEQTWFLEVLRKLDFLLDKFLQFASKEMQFRQYLLTVQAEASGEAKWLDDAFTAKRRQSKRTPSSGDGVVSSETWIEDTVEKAQSAYDEELNNLRARSDAETDEGTKSVFAKRIEVLERRRAFAGKIGKILVNLDQQLGLVEDTFGLISDEIRARPPEQVLADIEDVVMQTNSMTQVLEELAPYERSFSRTEI